MNGVEDIIVQSALYSRTVEEGLSVRALERLVKSLAEEEKQPNKVPKPILDTEYEQVQRQLSDHLETKIQLKVNDKGKGQIVIPFKNTAALNRILDLMKA